MKKIIIYIISLIVLVILVSFLYHFALNYSNKGRMFYVNYPKDFIVTLDTSDTLSLEVPKDKYFHWPLLDDVKITVTASSTCPLMLSDSLVGEPQVVTINGNKFIRKEGNGVGAGNLYREFIYDTISNGTCYHLDLFSHGTNGAGFYVNEPDLIAKYDAQHKADMDAMLSIFTGMVNSFRIVL